MKFHSRTMWWSRTGRARAVLGGTTVWSELLHLFLQTPSKRYWHVVMDTGVTWGIPMKNLFFDEKQESQSLLKYIYITILKKVGLKDNSMKRPSRCGLCKLACVAGLRNNTEHEKTPKLVSFHVRGV